MFTANNYLSCRHCLNKASPVLFLLRARNSPRSSRCSLNIWTSDQTSYSLNLLHQAPHIHASPSLASGMVGMQACCHEENRFTTRRLRPQVIESRRNVNRSQRSMRRELQNRPVVAPRRCRTVGQLLERVPESRTLARAWKPRQPIQPAHVQTLAPQLPASGARGKPQHFSTCLMGLADICSENLTVW